MPAPRPVRPRALALGLVLPLALAGAASAQQGSPSGNGWVDPPARPAAAEATRRGPEDAKGGAARTGAAKAGIARTDTTRTDTTRAGAASAGTAVAPEDDALPKASAARAAAPGRARAVERSEGREADRSRRAATPAVGPDPSDRAAAARALAARYLAVVSASGSAMVGATARLYAARVRFYGRPMTLAGLVAEKRGFVRRWPERHYEPRAIRTACDARTCTVRAVVDFRAASPGRGAVSSGAAELILEVGFSGPHPVILAETGRVLRRGAQAAAPARSLVPAFGKA